MTVSGGEFLFIAVSSVVAITLVICLREYILLNKVSYLISERSMKALAAEGIREALGDYMIKIEMEKESLSGLIAEAKDASGMLERALDRAERRLSQNLKANHAPGGGG